MQLRRLVLAVFAGATAFGLGNALAGEALPGRADLALPAAIMGSAPDAGSSVEVGGFDTGVSDICRDAAVAAGRTGEIETRLADERVEPAPPAERSTQPAPSGVGVVPPDILMFAVRAHTLYPVVPVSVALAQWAKESGWNQAMPSGSNNPFGIKCYDQARGCTAARTREQDSKGRQTTQTLKFQAFPSLQDAFVEHARILATLGFYRTARNASDIDGFARGLTAYATDKDYTASLIRDYLRPYDLYRYDECFFAMDDEDREYAEAAGPGGP